MGELFAYFCLCALFSLNGPKLLLAKAVYSVKLLSSCFPLRKQAVAILAFYKKTNKSLTDSSAEAYYDAFLQFCTS